MTRDNSPKVHILGALNRRLTAGRLLTDRYTVMSIVVDTKTADVIRLHTTEPSLGLGFFGN